MASTTPAPDALPAADAPIAAPVAATPAKVEAAPVPKADPVPAKAPAAASAPKAPVKAVKPALKSPAPVAPAVAKKKVAVKAAPKTAETIIKPAVAQATAIVTKEETMETTIKNAAEKAKSMFTDAGSKGGKVFADMNEFSKGNIDAIVESGKIAAKGLEAMGQDAADYGRKQFEGATAVLKSLSSVKSPTDFFKLQGDYMRTSFDSMVAHTSKSTEAMLKLAGEVAQPIQNRVAVAVEKVKIAA